MGMTAPQSSQARSLAHELDTALEELRSNRTEQARAAIYRARLITNQLADALEEAEERQHQPRLTEE